MIDFSTVKAITIPEGSALNIQAGGSTIWRKHSVSYGDLNYELSGDGCYYSCVGVQDGVDATTITVADTVNGLPVLAIGAGAFSTLTGLTKVTFEATPTSIADDAFTGCDSLATVAMPGASDVLDSSPWGSAADRPTFYIEGVQYRKHNSNASRYVVDVPSSTLFQGGDIELVSSIGGVNVYELDSGCFKNKTTLTGITIPATVNVVEASVFSGCTGLMKVTFLGTPKSIPATAFDGCTNLTTINVPWAEGAVANAPWGATNATINYNYTS